MLGAVLFLLMLGAMLLVVAVFALRRQVRMTRLAMTPVSEVRGWVAGDAEKAPIVSAPSLAKETLTIGGATRDRRFLLLVFVEPQSALCESLIGAALELCRERDVRLVLAGDGDSAGYETLLRRKKMQPGDFVLSGALKDVFLIGPIPSVVLLDADGHLMARGAVQHREHLEGLLSSIPASRKAH